MNGVIDQVLPPNTVDFCRNFRLPVSGKIEDSLLLVKNNVIEIYRIRRGKLTLHSRHEFPARIQDLQIIPSKDESSERIIVTFAECKVSVSEYCNELSDFVTKSLHFFEREEYRTTEVLGTVTSLRPRVAVDPEGRLAAVRVFSSFLALVELNKNGDEFSTDKASDEEISSNTMGFDEIDARLKKVVDVAFLPGFLNPTIAVLYEISALSDSKDTVVATSALRAGNKKAIPETKGLLLISIEPGKSPKSKYQFTVVNSVESLPWDCEKIMVLPRAFGGIFLLSQSFMLWLDAASSAAPFIISTNSYARISTSLRISNTEYEKLNISTLIDSKIVEITCRDGLLKGLLICSDGLKFSFSVRRSGRSLGSIEFKNIDFKSSVVSDVTKVGDGFMFLASHGGNCQLVKIEQATELKGVKLEKKQKAVTSSINDEDAFLYGSDAVNTKSSNVDEVDPYLALLEEETSSAPSKKPKVSSSSSGDFSISLVDELTALGGIVDMAIGYPSEENEEHSSGNKSLDLVALAGGYTENGKFATGSVNILSQSLKPKVMTSFSLPDTVNIWTIPNTRTTTFECKYLVASTGNSSLVLQVSEARIVELEESDFYLEGRTLFCGLLNESGNGKSCIIQVHQMGLRLLDAEQAKLIKEENVVFAQELVKICVWQNYLLMLDAAGNFSSHSFDLGNMKKNECFTSESVSCFDVWAGKVFLLTMKGVLTVYELESMNAIFKNSFADRLPAVMLNRLNQTEKEKDGHEVFPQVIKALDVFSGSFNELFVAVRYQYGNSREGSSCSTGVHVYRVESSRDGSLEKLVKVEEEFGKNEGPFNNFRTARVPGLNQMLLYGSNQVLLCSIGERNYPRLHRISQGNASVLAMAPYNADQMMILTSDGQVKICKVIEDESVDFDWQSGWILKRLSIPERVPVKISYHSPSRTYLVISSPEKYTFTLPQDEYANISDNMAFNVPDGTTNDAKLNAANPDSLHLLNPLNWSFVDEAAPLNEYEVITCVDSFELTTKKTSTGYHQFLLIGTVYQKTEDRPMRGRIGIYDVAEVVPEPGKPETNKKLRLKGFTEMKGPVICFAGLMEGNVAVSLGARIFVHSLEDDEKLTGVALQDLGTCTISMTSMKNFFAASDLTNSLSFLAFQPEPSTKVHLLGKDFGQCLEGGPVEFLVSASGQLMILQADGQGGLHFFAYAPNNLTSNLGQRLLSRGSFNVHSAPITRMLRLPSRTLNDLNVLAAGADGSLHLISPITSRVFRRLFLLEMRLGGVIPGRGGLNLRVARQVPLRTTISQAIPVKGMVSYTTPSTLGKEGEDYSFNTTLIPHSLPVSNSFVDGAALRRFLTDPLIDAKARRILANRFNLDLNTIVDDLCDLRINELLF